ncbi:hypothetical protein CEXT_118421 [Caerostris extrusa]|uniref:Uncharacterized protein n=1 Tax=Caerostris extrusa TaxID=172846 RepID=A0AAV4UFU6_CAEEX|nr:hypothetical protein CEXT_118421 [Caerostris extrusa]
MVAYITHSRAFFTFKTPLPVNHEGAKKVKAHKPRHDKRNRIFFLIRYCPFIPTSLYYAGERNRCHNREALTRGVGHLRRHVPDSGNHWEIRKSKQGGHFDTRDTHLESFILTNFFCAV